MANPHAPGLLVHLGPIAVTAVSLFAFACSSSSGTSNAKTNTGGSSAGGAGNSAGTSSAGASAGGATSSGTGGSGGAIPLTYDVIGDNNASWAGCSTGDTIAANSHAYLPMTTSDCPQDADMAIVKPYVDKIFNGCLDECFGDTNMAGHGKATVFDWTIKSGGWAVAEMSSTLHWTGMYPPSTGPNPITLVFWIKGAVGGEEQKFTVAIHEHGGNTNSAAVKVPLTITQKWQRVVIPWASFKAPASPYPDALTFAATAAGHVTFFVDQAYLSKTVPLP